MTIKTMQMLDDFLNHYQRVREHLIRSSDESNLKSMRNFFDITLDNALERIHLSRTTQSEAVLDGWTVSLN